MLPWHGRWYDTDTGREEERMKSDDRHPPHRPPPDESARLFSDDAFTLFIIGLAVLLFIIGLAVLLLLKMA